MNSYWPIYFDFREGIDRRIVWSRVSGAMRRDPSGRWRDVPALTPRLHYDINGLPLGLLAEATEVNQVVNVRMAGALVGTPGTLPNGYTKHETNCTSAVSAVGESNGIPWTEFTVTATGAGSFEFRAPISGVSIAAAGSAAVALFAASVGVLPPQVTGASVSLPNASPATLAVTLPSTGLTERFSHTGSYAAGTTTPDLGFLVTFDGSCTFVVRVGGYQYVQNSTAIGSPIREAPGGSGPTTRFLDGGTALVRDWGLQSASAGMLLVSYRPNLNAPTRNIFSVGSAAGNRVVFARLATGSIAATLFSASGSVVTGSAVGTAPGGADVTFAASWSLAEGLRLSVNGAAPSTTPITARPDPIPDLLFREPDGPIARLAYRPLNGAAPTNADLQTLSRQGPIA